MKTIALALLSLGLLFAAGPATDGPPKLEADNVNAGEGPTWDPAGGWLYFSGQNRVTKWRPGGQPEVVREGAGVPDDVFEAVRKHYSEREVVELTVLTSVYIMHNRIFTALKVDLEPKKG